MQIIFNKHQWNDYFLGQYCNISLKEEKITLNSSYGIYFYELLDYPYRHIFNKRYVIF